MLTRCIDIDFDCHEPETWAQVEALLGALPQKSWAGANFCVENPEQERAEEMVIVYFEPLGFHVSLAQANSVLTDETLGGDWHQYDNLSGAQSPRYCFVNKPLMLEAARHFFETGQQAPYLSWKSVQEVTK